MHKKVSDISNITPGYTFRKSIENKSNGDIFVLQAKNIILNEDISSIADFTKIDSGSLRNPSFIEHNDILIVSRGSGLNSFRSTIFTLDRKDIIASSSVIVIRIKDITVLSKYVSLYLNSQDGQKSINQIVSGGSYLQTLLIRNLSDLMIPIPPLQIQKSIIALNENIKKQEIILERKREIKQNIINATFINLTK